MQLYFVRHGTAYGTLNGLCQGTSLCEGLTEDGIREVEARAAQMLASNLQPARIYSSRIVRAMQTADILAKALNAKIIYDDGLRERDYGEWENRPFSEVQKQLEDGITPPDGEPAGVFVKRVADTILTIAAKAEPSFIVSHGGVWQALHDYHKVEAPWIMPADAFLLDFTKQRFQSQKFDG